MEFEMPDIDQIAEAVENFTETADTRFEALETRRCYTKLTSVT